MKKITKTRFKCILAIFSAITFVGQPIVSLAAVLPNANTTTTNNSNSALSPAGQAAEVNSAINQSSLPSLTVSFDKTAIRDGDIVTATAIPVGFAYKEDSLYYTWFLKHDGNKMETEKEINDAKIEAAKIIARNKFDKTSANYSEQTFGDKDKGYLALPGWELDEDDYSGLDRENVEKADSQNCYLQDYKTGQIWELSSSESTFNCPTGTTAQCVKDQAFAVSPNECEYDDPNFNPLLPEDPIANPRKTKEGPKNACVQQGDSAADSKPNCVTSSAQNFESVLSCNAGYEGRCISGGGTIFSKGATDLQVCSAFGLGDQGKRCTDTDINAAPTSLQDAVDGNGDPVAPTVKCERVKKDNTCKHLFAEADTGEIGDGKYTLGEERFWGTNPENKSTAGNENNDEMNLVGLGQNMFTWTYHDGDEIGVVVEGMAEQGTKHSDASKMISWAFSKNSCPAFSEKVAETPADQKEYYIDKNSENRTEAGILNIDDFDANDCLKDNLINPAVAGKGVLDVSLTYSPENPINYPAVATGSNAGLSKGDVVKVVSNVNNVDDASGYYYKWSIEGRDSNSGMQNIDDEGWIDITSEFSDHTAIEGIGKVNFDFKMNLDRSDFPDNSSLNPKYIRVKVTVKESSGVSGTARNGTGQAVLKINNPSVDLVAYPVKIQEGKPILNKDFVICGQDVDPCPVVNGEIVGIELPDEDGSDNFTQFNWNYNKENLLCDKKISSECDDSKPVDLAFFPVVGQEGDSIEITLAAKEGETGINQEFSKTFNIVKPSIKITSENTADLWLKVTGYSKDLSGNISPLYGQDVFQAVTNTTINLRAAYFPTFIKKNLPIKWSINGEIVETDPVDRLVITVDEPIGSSYNVDISGTYSQFSEVRKALSDIWGINAFDSREQPVEASAQIEMIESDSEDSTNVGSITASRIFASVITNIPQQLMFFMRIMITAALLLMVTGLIFSIMPGGTNRESD